MSTVRTADHLGALLVARLAKHPFESIRFFTAIVDPTDGIRLVPTGQAVAEFLAADLPQLAGPLRRVSRPGEVRCVVVADDGARVISIHVTPGRLAEARRARPLAG